MAARERTVQPVSQATPLAEDLLGFLQGRIGPGGLQPLTGLQRQAGNFLENFLALGPEQLSPLLSQLEDIQQRRVGESAANLREGFSIGGARFGTQAAGGEARLRRELEDVFGAQIGQLLLQQQAQQVGAADVAGRLSAINIAPFVQLAGMGIFPTETFFEQSPFVTGLQGLAGLGAGVGGLLSGLGPFGAGLFGPNLEGIFAGGGGGARTAAGGTTPTDTRFLPGRGEGTRIP